MSYYLLCFICNGRLISFNSSSYDDENTCLFFINKFIFGYFDDERSLYHYDDYHDALEFIVSCGIDFRIVPRLSLNKFLKDLF